MAIDRQAVLAEATRQRLMQPGPSNIPAVGAFRTGPEPRRGIGKEQLELAQDILTRYKQGRTNLESRIVEDELWWELRHWEVIGKTDRAKRICGQAPRPEPTSAWLFNAITNKHADAMDNYPEPVVLPREESDEESARALSSVLPVVLERNEFERTYSAAWWEKLKHGTAAYGVFWNSEKENGLGDIDIVPLDLLNVFWEPGITDIQDSRNLFITELVERDELEQQYPQYAGKFGDILDVKEYIYDDSVDNSTKLVVIDWYYKVREGDGRQRVHYVKFCGDCLLYASENDPAYAERGYYDHGRYPVVMDVLFPEKGTPAGFGYVAICKDPQLYIDKLSAGILENTMQSSRKRFFVSTSTGINEKELLDWNKPLVHVEGELSEGRIQEITTQSMGTLPIEVMQLKIDEMKETAANRDVNAGGSGGGVTAASAISALQEAGNKVSRDMIAASYRAYTQIADMCIELIRQFYDEARTFRIIAPNGDYQFLAFSGASIRGQPIGFGADGMEMIRVPVFDLKIKAQKGSPFSRIEQNSRAQELYSMGFFDPERAQASLIALEMMDFEGVDKVRDQVREGQTLFNMLQQAMATIAVLTGQDAAQTQQGASRSGGGSANTGEQRQARDVGRAQQTPMQQRMAAASTPTVEGR